MSLNLSDIKTKRREIVAEQSRGNLWRPGKGSNRIRLSTWESPVTGKTEFFREIWMHQSGKGQPVHVCGNSPDRTGVRSGKCQHCDQYNAIVAGEGKQKAQPFKVKKRFVFVCVPVEKMDAPFTARKPFQFAAAQLVGDAIIKIVSDCDEVKNVNDYFGSRGLDFRINFDPDAPPVAMYSVKVLPKIKSDDLDPALFAQVTAIDPFGDDAHEPPWYLEAQGKEAKAVTEDGEPLAPPVETAPKAAPPAASVAAPAPAAVTQPAVNPKFLTLDQAKALLAQPGLEGWKASTDPDGDAYFIAPNGKDTQYDAPTPTLAPKVKKAPPAPPPEAAPSGKVLTPEAQMAARGMKPAQTPPAQEPDDSKDNPGPDEG